MRHLLVLAALLVALPAHAVVMEWVTVGDPGNAPDNTGPLYGLCGPDWDLCGAVPYTYRIGRYEVTNAQYAEFLNAVDPTGGNALALYNPNMASGWWGGIDFESGNPDGSKYVPKSEMASKPVNYVEILDSFRFVNWLNNGQGTASTETGAYTLLGGTPLPSNWETVTRNAGAIVFLPNEDEWYKAAFFDGTTYFDYPAGSDAEIECVLPSADSGNSANCNQAVNDLTDVGSYSLSGSPYGTFDQGGNVHEWNEEPLGAERHIYGGNYFSEPFRLAARRASILPGGGEWDDVGFRVAMIVECDDGLDDDGDGFTDYPSDPGCADADDLSERSPLLPCDDGADNDGDTLTDYTEDPGCRNPTASVEDPACQDGQDNDGDTMIDFDGGLSALGYVAAEPDPNCPNPYKNSETASSSGCGLGTELLLLLPPVMWLYWRRSRTALPR